MKPVHDNPVEEPNYRATNQMIETMFKLEGLLREAGVPINKQPFYKVRFNPSSDTIEEYVKRVGLVDYHDKWSNVALKVFKGGLMDFAHIRPYQSIKGLGIFVGEGREVILYYDNEEICLNYSGLFSEKVRTAANKMSNELKKIYIS